MQCPSCGFNNLPGIERCARCLGMLALEGVSVHPYRASDRGARRRRLRARVPLLLERVRRAVYALAGVIQPTTRYISGRQRLSWVLLSTFVPGLGLVAAGRKQIGYALMIAWWITVALTLLLWAYFFAVLAALAVGIHTYAILLSMFNGLEFVTRRGSLLTGVLVWTLLAFGLYPAAGWLLTGIVRAQQLGSVQAGRYLQTGDVVLTEGRWRRPGRYERGDVVSYWIHRQQGPGWYTGEGAYIDRIIGVAGDVIRFEHGRLLVNGREPPASESPLAPVLGPDRYEYTVPEGAYYIYPTMANLRGNAIHANTDLLTRLSTIQSNSVLGRILMVLSPPGRIRRL